MDPAVRGGALSRRRARWDILTWATGPSLSGERGSQLGTDKWGWPWKPAGAGTRLVGFPSDLFPAWVGEGCPSSSPISSPNSVPACAWSCRRSRCRSASWPRRTPGGLCGPARGFVAGQSLWGTAGPSAAGPFLWPVSWAFANLGVTGTGDGSGGHPVELSGP